MAKTIDEVKVKITPEMVFGEKEYRVIVDALLDSWAYQNYIRDNNAGLHGEAGGEYSLDRLNEAINVIHMTEEK